MPLNEHLQRDLDKLTQSYTKLSDSFGDYKVELVEAIGEAKQEIMNEIKQLSSDQAKINQAVAVDIATIKAKAAMLGMLGGFAISGLVSLLVKFAH